MEKKQLATSLRSRQRYFGGQSNENNNSQTDSDVINNYITCPECGEMMAGEDEVDKLIEKAKDMEEFLLFSIIDIVRHDH